MTDYNLGRATGEIRIGYDDTGARRAQVDMAAVAAEAEALDKAMGRVNKSFDDNHKLEIATAEDLIRARGELERLRQAYQAYQQEFNVAERKQREAAQAARDVLRDQANDLDAVREANNRLNVAEDEVNRKRRIASDALQEYNARYASLHAEIDKFNQAHREASTGLSNIARNAEKAGEAIESLNDKLSAVARILGQAGIFGLFGGAAGGALGILASGGVQALAQAMSAVVEVANSFVGAIALIPAAATAAGLAIGTLVVGFHGIGAALGSIGDPAKFIAAIKDLSPAAQQAMLTIQSFTEAFRGARDEIQNSLFAPIIADIQPLIQTWLPQLMNAGKEIANQFGQSMHQVFAFMQDPAQVASFKTFTDNLVSGFAAARGAIQPFLQAWTTLATVGSGVFERLGTAITTIANEFNNWIQRTAQSGQLLEFINRALDGFTNMGHIIRDVAFGIENVFGLFREQNGSALESLARISAEFRSWSASAQGIGAIGGFFTLIKAGAAALRPELQLVGESLAIVGRTLTVLGIAIQPGLSSFFTSFRDALAGLAPFVIQLAPAINQFLTAFGQTLLQVVNSIGPKLPGFFQDMSDAFIELMQILPPVVDLFARLLGNLTPGEVETILALTIAFKALSATIPLVRGAIIALNFVMAVGPVGWTVAAIAALVLAGVALYENWDTVKEKFGELTSTFGGMTGILNTLKTAWSAVANVAKNFWSDLAGGVSGGWQIVLNALGTLSDSVRGFFFDIWQEAYDWGHNIIDRFVAGIRSMLQPVTDVMNEIMGKVSDPVPQSPAKTGPLAGKSGEDLGAHFVSQFAAGMTSATPSVTAAASGVAGQAGAIGGAGFGSTPFSSAGVSGKSGQDFSQGHSGFDQWINYITKDLTAWNNIFQEAFGLVNSIQEIVTGTARLAANLWNGGDNPLTQPGGLYGPPLPIAQQEVPGVQNKPIPGQAPDAAFRKQGVASPQQSVSGVPNKPIPGTRSTPASATPSGQPGVGAAATGAPPANPPASTAGQDPPAVAGSSGPQRSLPQGGSITMPPNPTKEQVQQTLAARARAEGLSEQEVAGVLALAQTESNFDRVGFLGFSTQTTDTGYTGGAPFANDYNKAMDQFFNNYKQGGLAAAGGPDVLANARAALQGGNAEPYLDWLQNGLQGAVSGQGGMNQEFGPNIRRAYGQWQGSTPQSPASARGVLRQVAPPTVKMTPGPAQPGGAPGLSAAGSSPIVVGGVAGAASLAALLAKVAGGTATAAEAGQLSSVYGINVILGGSGEAVATTATGVTLGSVAGLAAGGVAGAAALMAGSAAFGSATGQRDLDVTPFNAGPRAPGAPPAASTTGAAGPSIQGQAPPFQSIPYGLPTGTDTGGYGTGNADTFPPWLIALGAQFGVKPSTYGSHQESDRFLPNGQREPGYAPNPQHQNRGVDWVGSPEQMQAFAQALLQYGGAEGSGGALEQVIYQAGPGGQKYGLGGAGNIDTSYYPQSGQGSYDEHGGGPSGAHVHTRFSGSVPVTLGGPTAPTPPPTPPAQVTQGGLPGSQSARRGRVLPPNADLARTGLGQSGDATWMNVPQGWDLSQPIPLDVRRAHGISDELPDMFYNAQPDTVSNIPVPPDFGRTHPDSIINQGTTSLPTGTGAIAGFTQTNDQRSPMDKWTSAFSGASSIAGDGFKIFGDVIADIGAAAHMTDTLVRGFANTEDIVGFIKDIQPFLQTGADVAKLVGDVGGIVAGAGSADPTGGAGAAGAGIQAISAIVGSAFDIANQGITLGIDIYHELGKYAGYILGDFLGGPDTGPLGGNVRMLLNTKTNQLQTYSENNPLLKNTFDVPNWQRSYTQTPNAIQGGLPPQVNIYTGPGQTPQAMMAESMWMVSTGSAPVASVAGVD